MKIFLKANHKCTGIDRALSGFTIFGAEIEYIDHILLANKFEGENAIFGGFIPAELGYVNSFRKKYYIFCSPFGQADLSGPNFYSPEIALFIELSRLYKTNILHGVLVTSRSIAGRFEWAKYCPTVFARKEMPYVNQDQRKNYGFLGNNTRKHKNVVNQIAAISMLEPKEPIVVRDKGMWTHFAELFNCEFKGTGPLTDDAYFEEIASHRLCFQCSWSESFDYQALEYMLCGVPVIGSPCLSWMNTEFAKTYLIADNIDSCYDIFYVAQHVLDYHYDEASRAVEAIANEVNESNKEELERLYDELSA